MQLVKSPRIVLAGLVSVALAVLAASTATGQALQTDALRLDELRIRGTHNSYHKRPLIALHPRHRYEHDSLFVQLEYHGVRALELDLHRGDDGYEVYHIRFIDGRTHCRALVDCLSQIRAWSDLDRRHEPLMIWLEAKDYAGGQSMESLRPVDDVLRTVLGDRLLTPDDIRGAHPSLHSALQAEGWPTLGETRGRILFMLTADLEQRLEYTSGFRHLRGRVMFVESFPGEHGLAWASVAKVWRGDDDLVRRARRHGLLVSATTCTADKSDMECALTRQRALRNGVNIFMDDYPRITPDRTYYLDLGSEVVTAIAEKAREAAASDLVEPGG